MTESRMPRPTSWRPLLLLALAIVACYWGVLRNEFVVLDDQVWIVGNQQVQNGLTLDGIRWAFQTEFGATWQPLVWISWMIDRSLYGEGPAGFHFTNLLLHLAASLLLFSAFRRMLGSSSIPLLIAALYALHPVQVESVAWAAERKGLIAAFFWMLALEFYSHYRTGLNWRSRVAIFISMLLGLMAKSTLLTFPFALLLLDVWPRQRLLLRSGWGPMLREKAGLLALVPVFLVVGFRAQAGFGAVRGFDLVSQFPAVVIAYARSLGHLFAPFQLGPLYTPPVDGFSPLVVGGSIVVLAGATLVIHRFRCPLPALWIGWVWFLVTLLPFSGIVAIGGHFMADRYLLIPSVGLWLGVVFLLKSVFDRNHVSTRARWIVACAVVVVLGGMTFRQVNRWSDSTRLFTYALEADADNYLVEFWLGEARAQSGDFTAAAQHFSSARQTNPGYDLAWFKEGSALLELQRHEEAAVAFEGYLQLRPHQFKGWMNLGVSYGRLGRMDDALPCFERALEIAPNDAQARANRDRARAALSARGGATDE